MSSLLRMDRGITNPLRLFKPSEKVLDINATGLISFAHVLCCDGMIDETTILGAYPMTIICPFMIGSSVHSSS